MSLDRVIVMGTLKAGPGPGRVQVAIAPTPTPTTGGPRRTLLDVLDEVRATQTARGYQGRSIGEMEADEAARRAEDEEYEERWRTLWNQTTSAPPRGTEG